MLNKLFLNILPDNQSKLLEKISKENWISKFYLAGGTALALQLGHRQSIDFDLFSFEDFNTLEIVNKLNRLGDFNLFSEKENTINGELDNIKISIIGYKYPLLKMPLNYNFLRIADILDISLMKLSAISGRGSKKDFIDLFYILKQFSIDELFKIYHNKFGTSIANGYHLLKSLIYFEDAENDPMPIMIAKTEWEDIKEFITLKIKKYNLK
jgi:predicted nucleotidyltransferase component of viral defense system